MPVRKTSVDDLRQLLTKLGVGQGDTVMVHSAVFTLGLIEDGLDGMYRAFRSVIGESGTLIVPTFTYSYRRGTVFDIRHSKPFKSIGVFAEHVLTLEDSFRSSDPLFSMAAVGPRAEVLMNRHGHNSFGKGSTYEKIFDTDALIVAIGITYDTGITAFLHLERLARVDYRREERFDGTSIGYDGSEYQDWAIHFVRDEERFPLAKRNRGPIGQAMEELGVSIAYKFGSGNHFALRCQPFAKYVLSELESDPYAMMINTTPSSSEARKPEIIDK